GRWPAWPTCATAGRSRPRSTRPRRRTCCRGCSSAARPRAAPLLLHAIHRSQGAFLNLSPAQVDQVIAAVIVVAIMLLVALPIHEFSHALAAYRLGDGTAKMF